MGNRAVVKPKSRNVGVYLHWNGGRDSVEGFLKYCELRGFRDFGDDYGLARFTQIVSNFLRGDLSIGITDRIGSPGDNGIYIVDGWEIVGREDYQGAEQNEYDLNDMLMAIDEKQPVKDQLGEDFFKAKEVSVEDLKIGDTVFHKYMSEYVKAEVVGIGEDKVVNGMNVKGIPYINQYGWNGEYENNINNYLREETVRKVDLDAL